MSNIIDGRKTVTTAGTAVQLGGSQEITSVIVQPLSGNTTAVEVGASTVLAAASTQRGIRLLASATVLPTVTLVCDDLADVWVDAVTNGEGVSFIASSEV